MSPKKKHRTQKFRKEWQNLPEFKGWLTEDRKDPFKAHCKVCNISFVSEVQVIKKHGKGQKHKTLVNSDSIQPQTKLTQFTTIPRISEKTQRAEIQLASFFAEHNISFRAANHLTSIIKSNFSDSAVAKDFTLKRTKCTAVVKNVIGTTFQEELISKLKANKFSLLIDESTDISTTKAMCIVVRFYDPSQGKVVSQFLDLKNIHGNSNNDKSGTAANLYKTVIDSLDSYTIPHSNLIGFASDGCNSMMGAHNSVASRLKADFQGITILKCVCHSLHLCASEACKVLPSQVEELVRGVFNFMHNSAKRMAMFEQFQKFLELKIHKLLHPSQTRWLSVIAAVLRVLEQWDALKLFFTDMHLVERQVHAEQLYKWLHDPFIKMYLLFLKWILPKFTTLNEYFQTKRVVITSLHVKFVDTYKEILLTFLDHNYVMRSYDKEHGVDVERSQFWLGLNEMYLGVDIMMELQKPEIISQEENLMSFKENCRQFLIRGAKEIQKRYDFNHPILSKLIALRKSTALCKEFHMKQPTILPLLLSVPRIASNKEIWQDIDDEWRRIPLLSNQFPDLEKINEDDEFWHKLLDLEDITGQKLFQHLPKFALEVLSLPHSNADCERIFSKINNMKTKSRNKLITETVRGLLLASEGVGNCSSFIPSNEMMKKMTASMYSSSVSSQTQSSSSISSVSTLYQEDESISDDNDDVFFTT